MYGKILLVIIFGFLKNIHISFFPEIKNYLLFFCCNENNKDKLDSSTFLRHIYSPIMEVEEDASRLMFCGGSAGISDKVIQVISSDKAPSPLALKADT